MSTGDGPYNPISGVFNTIRVFILIYLYSGSNFGTNLTKFCINLSLEIQQINIVSQKHPQKYYNPFVGVSYQNSGFRTPTIYFFYE